MVETTFSHLRVFHWFLLTYADIVHETSYISPSKYDTTSGTQISIHCVFEKNGDETVDQNKNL